MLFMQCNHLVLYYNTEAVCVCVCVCVYVCVCVCDDNVCKFVEAGI